MAEPATVDIDGAKLRELRKFNGDSLSTFAARAGITFQYLSQLELGTRRRVSPPTFAKICDALGITDRRQMTTSIGPPAPCAGDNVATAEAARSDGPGPI